MPAASRQRSSYTLEQVLQACEDFLRTYGFVNYAEIGRRLGISRQAVQLRLKTAHDKGQIDDYTFQRLRPSLRNDNVEMCIKVAPETRAFLNGMAERLDLRVSTIVEAAITKYRHSLPELGDVGAPSTTP